MRFSKIGDLDTVTRITGPHHHFLGIGLSCREASPPPLLERVALETGDVTVEPSDAPGDLRREVLDAVSEANRELGTDFRVTKIRYCEGDAAIPGLYGRLARSLVEHVAWGRKDAAGPNPGREAGGLIAVRGVEEGV